MMAVPTTDEISRLQSLLTMCRAAGVNQLRLGELHFVLDQLPIVVEPAKVDGPPSVESVMAPEHVDLADALHGIGQ